MSSIGSTYPARRFVVALPAREAVRVVVDVLRREGFSLESWDVDPFLREYGPWTGAALRRGHAIKLILLTPVVYMVAPLALLFPWVRRSLGVVKMVAMARDIGQGRSELLVGAYRIESEWISSGAVAAAKMLIATRERMGDLGVLLVADPEQVDRYEGLPDDHPFQMQQWWRIRRAAQKAARSRH
ncbi:hypothetical protein [Actinomyces glycerinitolerans]|uniref:hypothetical protein n=1 Tax=Actinomyces glycerinitolerans TaxID=1892869 RepID=UPI00111482C5|nr:hypothetical protein [Actinomyces glycerinitolerans]